MSGLHGVSPAHLAEIQGARIKGCVKREATYLSAE